VLADEDLPDDERDRKQKQIQMTEGLGEPWLTFFRREELRARLLGLGFSRAFHLTAAEANARYFAGRQDGMHVRPLEQLSSATV
jgi:O-methyltransferase involved in polyketide biosynthesis